MSIIQLQDVYFTYNRASDSEVRAVNGVTLSINEGEFVAIVGHNGSGKSTLAKLMNGLITPDKGKVTVAGLDTANEKNLFDIRRNVGVVFQNPDNQMVATIIEDDVADQIRERVYESLKSVGMYDYREGTPHRLSGGQKQRVAIAGVLALRPRVMVLDESTSMLDPCGRADVMKVVNDLNKKEKMAVVMITHFMEEAVTADRIIVMNEGRIYMQGGKEIFKRQAELESIGLTVPLASRVANRLREKGVVIDEDVTTYEELVNKICPLE